MLIEHQHQPGVFDPATAKNAPARRACWSTTTRCNARSRPSGRHSGGPAGPSATPSGRCGRPGIGLLLAAIALLTG